MISEDIRKKKSRMPQMRPFSFLTVVFGSNTTSTQRDLFYRCLEKRQWRKCDNLFIMCCLRWNAPQAASWADWRKRKFIKEHVTEAAEISHLREYHALTITSCEAFVVWDWYAQSSASGGMVGLRG
jgi:hypothetical protein